MHIPKNAKLELVCAKGDARYALNEPWLIGDAIVATNGHTCVFVPIERAGVDTDGPIPIAALKAIRFGSKSDPGFLTANGSVEVTDKHGAEVSFKRDEDKPQFPNVKRLEESALQGDVEYEISFDAKLLANTAAAMGTERVTIKLRGDNVAMEVRPLESDNEARAITMPCRA